MSIRIAPLPPAEFQKVIDRLKEVLALPTNKAVAEALGLTASNLGERKNRGALPVEQIEQLCSQHGIRPEWVLEGLLPVYLEGRVAFDERLVGKRGAYAPPLDGALMGACLQAVEVALEEGGIKLPADRRARLVATVYEFSLGAGRVNRDVLQPLIRLVSG